MSLGPLTQQQESGSTFDDRDERGTVERPRDGGSGRSALPAFGLIGLALKFHGLNTASTKTYTLTTVTAQAPGVGSVLFINQPLAQVMLVNIFGK
jgi:hypothetical protein